MALLFHLFQDVVGDRSHLRGIRGVANDEIIGNGSVDAPQVQRDDILPFLVQDGVGDEPEVMRNHILSKKRTKFAHTKIIKF